MKIDKLNTYVLGFVLPFAISLLSAQTPAWWAERGVTNSQPADDFAAVNQGQVKNIAKQSYEQLKARLPTGVGATLDSIWAVPALSTDDYQAVNIGQLKNVAKPFYDRLIALGYVAAYPWVGAPASADDYALANVGQVKNLFTLNVVFLDTDGDGMSDLWEVAHGYNPNSSSDGPASFDSDGISNSVEFKLGTNPTVPAATDTANTQTLLKVYTPL